MSISMALLVLVVAGYIAHAMRGRGDAAPAPASVPPSVAFNGDCDFCGFAGRVVLVELGRSRACGNCLELRARERGDCPRWANLPPGHVVGICWGCHRETLIRRSDGTHWRCLTCAPRS